ncbi:hypothetical protein F4823DRAFT_224429 [Ustulina deusta]|nr:hypothetical protein F4823DRAFT_224429 [Ustulina deusta]
MEALTEFHPYPRLPREVQNMIWGFYSKSLPVLRHNFHLHRAQNGDESCHYILYNEETKFFVQTQFRCEQDELSLVHGALTVPETSFPMEPRPAGQPGSKHGNSFYLAVNYEKDVFSFYAACCASTKMYGEAIANWFGLPSQLALEDVEGSSDRKEIEKQPTDDETPQRIFSARRLAFYAPSGSAAKTFPTFGEYDLQMLARFKRLKEIIFVVDSAQDAPASIYNRAISQSRDQHPVFGGLMVISHLDSAEHTQLLKGQNTKVDVMYALDLSMFG